MEMTDERFINFNVSVTNYSSLITDHLSPITDYGAVQREERKSKVKI